MNTPLVLLGPPQAGKSTVGRLLAESLSLPLLDLRSVARGYQEEIGYDQAAHRQAWETGGMDAAYRYMQPFEAHALIRAVAQQGACVLEVGAAQAVFEDADLRERVRQALAPCGEQVILLLPSPDADESERILEERRPRVLVNGREINEHFVRHHSNHNLAKHVVYTKDRTPEETCEEVAARVDPSAGNVLLIGPIGAGKSTIGKLLAQRLGVPQVALDAVRWDYYREIGWDEAEQKKIGEAEGFAGVYRYWKPFEAHAVERVLADHQNCVIDFGAGHSVHEDDAQFARIRDVLAPCANVVLLLPSPDLDESVALLNERHHPRIAGMDATRFFLTHPSHRALAKQVVYTAGKTPEQTRDDILRLCRAPGEKAE